jgi:outer membrane protein with beta-barrel domain
MLKTLMTIGALAGVLAASSMARAQALPTATAAGNLQVGAGYTYAKPDYGTESIKGASAFLDFDFRPHIGIEAAYHYIAFITPTDLAEDSFFVGPRFVLPYGRVNIYAKGMIGDGDLVIQEQQDNVGRQAGNFFAYSIGGGVDIRATNHIIIRAIDLESQHWFYQTGLTPFVLTVGAAYRFR